MDGSPPPDPIQLGISNLSRLMPMHLWMDRSGVIRSAGPTLAKLWPEPLEGRQFFEVFDLRKPLRVSADTDLAVLAGQRVLIACRSSGRKALRGIAVRAGNGGGTFINLSFGLSVAQAVRDHHLSHADFAPTDLTVELLYLTEVKGAVMGELAALNARLREAQQQAEAQAMTDPLTGLANRRAFEAALRKALSEADRGRPFALMHLDLDHFKAINDTYGHATGDETLRRVAAALRARTRGHDIVARIGGDEFVVIMHGASDERAVEGVAKRIIARIEQCAADKARTPTLSASIGAVISLDYPELQEGILLEDADAALYEAKRGGRGRCVIGGR